MIEDTRAIFDADDEKTRSGRHQQSGCKSNETNGIVIARATRTDWGYH